MANFEATTASNCARLKPGVEEKLKKVLAKYESGEVDYYIGGEQIAIYGYEWINFKLIDDPDYNDATDQMLKELSPFLAEPLLIHCVGATKCRFPLSAMEILVWPDREGENIIEYGGFEFKEDGSVGP